MGWTTAFPGQAEIAEVEAAGALLTYSDNPLFAERVQNGELPPIADRLPTEPLIILPYEECGTYGGTLRGVSLAPESGTSDILSWRQVNLVRMAEDHVTIVPNVAKSWEWNDDYTEIVFTLRSGHRWSDGEPFTAADIVFFFQDIIANKELNPEIPSQWLIGGESPVAEEIDPTHVRITFSVPTPGLLYYFSTNRSFFAPFAPRHHFSQYHGAYNENADDEARAAGFSGWVERFGTIYHRWKDAETLTAHALLVPTLESHVIEIEPNTERRIFLANPYYFKVDSSGQQLPYIDRHHERFLNRDLQMLAMLNGEVDYKNQSLDLSMYPVLKEGESAGGFTVSLPLGGIGPNLAFNITHKDPKLREIYGDLRFRQAISHAINRAELNEVLYFGLGVPMQAVPAATSCVTQANKDYMIEHDIEKANALLDEMGLAVGSEGWRTMTDGSPFTILWQYSTQFAEPNFVRLMLEYFESVHLNVNPREVPSEATRQAGRDGTADINMEWDVPFEPTLVSEIRLYVPPYAGTPLFGADWILWDESGGENGEEPPDWIKRMFEIAREWRTLLPGEQRYNELCAELVRLNQENMTIIGTVAELPTPAVVSDSLGNVPEFNYVHFNFGISYPYRADQWFFKE
jgi:peptide/nickel transport system substrate-binding protein